MANNSKQVEQGRVALVTGAAGIIGPGICKVLASDGWRVAAHDISEQHLQLPAHVGMEPLAAEATFVADLSQGRAACQQLISEVEERLGPVAAIVNNAAAHPETPPLEDVDDTYSRFMMEVNLLAPFYLIQAALPSLKSQGGAVVNLSSILVERPRATDLWYPVAKQGLEKLTDILAGRLLPEGVRCNTVRVGSVPGYAFMRKQLMDLPPEKARRMFKELIQEHVSGGDALLAKRRTSAEDIANAVAFLVSPLSAHVTGALLQVDGGMQVARRPGTGGELKRLVDKIELWIEENE